MLPLLPLFATELGAEPFVLGLLTSSFAVTNGIGQFVAGTLADRYGARRFISAGAALYASMNALIATAASALWLVTWRSLSGFGGGAVIVSERVYIAEITPPHRRAFANGILSAAASAGMVAGPAFGGSIAAIGGLRAPFIVVAVTSSIAFLASLALPKPSPAPAPARTETGELVADILDLRGVAALLLANLAILAGYGAFITTYAPLATGRFGVDDGRRRNRVQLLRSRQHPGRSPAGSRGGSMEPPRHRDDRRPSARELRWFARPWTADGLSCMSRRCSGAPA